MPAFEIVLVVFMLVLSQCFHTLVANHHFREHNANEQLIAEIPDIVVEYEHDGVVSLLEAFSSIRIDSANFTQWFSMGQPELVRVKKQSSSSRVFSRDVFFMTHQGFEVLIDLLTESQKVKIRKKMFELCLYVRIKLIE